MQSLYRTIGWTRQGSPSSAADPVDGAAPLGGGIGAGTPPAASQASLQTAGAAQNGAPDVGSLNLLADVGALPHPGSTSGSAGPGGAATGRIVLAAAGPEGEEEEERGPEGRPLSLQDEVNRDDWSMAYRALAKIDPRNPALSQITAQDWVPSAQNVQDIQAALARAQAKQEGLSPGDLKLPPELQPRNVGEDAPRTTQEILSPSGNLVGSVKPGTKSNVRTVSSTEFQRIENELLQGAELKNKSDYYGSWFARPDASELGIRTSDQSGETIDINDPSLPRGLKVHQSDN